LRKFADGYEMDISNPCIFLKIRILDDNIAKSVMDFLASNESIFILDTMFNIASIIVKTADFTGFIVLINNAVSRKVKDN